MSPVLPDLGFCALGRAGSRGGGSPSQLCTFGSSWKRALKDQGQSERCLLVVLAKTCLSIAGGTEKSTVVAFKDSKGLTFPK